MRQIMRNGGVVLKDRCGKGRWKNLTSFRECSEWNFSTVQIASSLQLDYWKLYNYHRFRAADFESMACLEYLNWL
jgi:hypothetical protein